MKYSKHLVVEELTAGKKRIVEEKLLEAVAQNLKWKLCSKYNT